MRKDWKTSFSLITSYFVFLYRHQNSKKMAIGFTMIRPDSMRSQMAALFLVTDSCLSYFICTLCSLLCRNWPVVSSVKSVSHSCGEKGRVVHKIAFPPVPIHPDKQCIASFE